MKTITVPYILVGCQPYCIHRGEDIVTEEVLTTKKQRGSQSEKFISITINPTCAKCKERGELRQSIYTRAEEARISAAEQGKTWTTAQKRWDKIADEWRHITCPFFIHRSRTVTHDLPDTVLDGQSVLSK